VYFTLGMEIILVGMLGRGEMGFLSGIMGLGDVGIVGLTSMGEIGRGVIMGIMGLGDVLIFMVVTAGGRPMSLGETILGGMTIGLGEPPIRGEIGLGVPAILLSA
jgi:hypothetical protein